jgi:hypothetical protein
MSQKRYLGLDLSGAKNAKTTLAVLEYYPKEEKIFLLDVHPGIGADGNATSDEALIETISDHADEHPDLKMGINVPLALPPCISCTRKSCPMPHSCTVPEVRWMRTAHARAGSARKSTSKRIARLKDSFTPYTQRPVELWLKNEVLSRLPPRIRFEIDETLGGNKAPLTGRMHFLKFHLGKYEMHEVLPKLTVALLMPFLKISNRTLAQYRQLDTGVQARETIIERMCESLDIFIYDRDLKKITQNINAFDAFLCAYTVLLHDRNQCVSPPRGFPIQSGWVRYPKSPLLEGDPDASRVAEAEENEEEEP